VNAFPDKPSNETGEVIAPQDAGDARSEGCARNVEGSSSAPAIVPVAAEASARGTCVLGEQEPATGTEVKDEVSFETSRDPAWTALDVLRLVFLVLVALLVSVFGVLFTVHFVAHSRPSIAALARMPLTMVAGQAVAYLLVLVYMHTLVTRERRRPDFLAAIHWNWPKNITPYLIGGVALAIALQLLAHLLPMPKNLPIDTFFNTPAEAWALTVFGITLGPLMEELFFRGFLYPVLVRGIGFTAAISVTAFAFALLHGGQLKFSWGPLLVIFLVGTVLTMVRAYKDSVGAGLLVHVAYNGTLSALMFAGTDGFRHLEKLNQ